MGKLKRRSVALEVTEGPEADPDPLPTFIGHEYDTMPATRRKKRSVDAESSNAKQNMRTSNSPKNGERRAANESTKKKRKRLNQKNPKAVDDKNEDDAREQSDSEPSPKKQKPTQGMNPINGRDDSDSASSEKKNDMAAQVDGSDGHEKTDMDTDPTNTGPDHLNGDFHAKEPPSTDAPDQAPSHQKPTPKTLSIESKKLSRQRRRAHAKLKKQKAKERSILSLPLDPPSESPHESTSISIQPPELQLDYLKDRQRKSLPNLSDLELESYPLEKSWLQDVSKKPLRAHLGSWLRTEAIPELLEAINQTPEIVATPSVLVVTSAGLRAADLCRQARVLVPKPGESGEVTKLFAKHFKLEAHLEHLKVTKVSIGIGTPDRIAKLMTVNDSLQENGVTNYEDSSTTRGLKLDRLKFLILDLTWSDPKGFNLIDCPDRAMREALWKSLLGYPKLIERFKSGQTKIVLF